MLLSFTSYTEISQYILLLLLHKKYFENSLKLRIRKLKYFIFTFILFLLWYSSFFYVDTHFYIVFILPEEFLLTCLQIIYIDDEFPQFLSEKVFIFLSLLKVVFSVEFECSGFCFFLSNFKYFSPISPCFVWFFPPFLCR